jgi:fumarylacetoacetase
MTWLNLPDDHPYGLDHLPYGSDGQRVLVRVGDEQLDLTAATRETPFEPLFTDGTLDPFLAAGRPVWAQVRALVTEWLTEAVHQERIAPLLAPVDEAALRLPFTVADYVDFYAFESHAKNVGRIFRPDSDGLTPNWKHLPIGYHGRAGTVIVSGADVLRPCGQSRGADGAIGFGPCRRLDIEAEVGFVVGTASEPGRPVPVGEFDEHVFGLCLLNDWSARDIQAWEYVPLGPFLGKSFATSVAAWITPLEALGSAWTAPPSRDPQPLPYLDDSPSDDAGHPFGLDLTLEVRLNGTVLARPPFSGMYWTPAQMLAHMTVNGAHVRTGDLFASGTVSGPQPHERGCLLELTWNGAEPVHLDDGSSREFLYDGDEVVLRAGAPGPHGRIRLAEVRGRIVPAPA